MINWNKYPFVRMLIPLALGIATAGYLGTIFIIHLGSLILIMAFSLLMLVAMSLWLRSYSRRWMFGALLNIYLFFYGMFLVVVNDVGINKRHFIHYRSSTASVVARLSEEPVEKDNSYKTVLDLLYVYDDSLCRHEVDGKIIAYFQKSDTAFALRYGDIIMFDSNIDEVSGPSNPEEFDYKDYLRRKGILYQTYLRAQSYDKIGEGGASVVYLWSYKVRDILLRVIARCGMSDDAYGVAAAILLGYDDSLPQEIRENYVAAGAMHILCVSGMHVGVIFLVASFLLSFLDRRKWGIVLKNVILLLLVWSYALVAGLSPSIMRASLMITFCIAGVLVNRKGYVLNSLAASAFILLCLNPNNLFEIGFQLSYAAVTGIVVLQKPIYNLLYVKNKLLDKIWEVTTVAIAAQIVTSPLAIFYFNQFPVYFWLSNLFLTPLSFVVIMSGMLLLALHWVPLVSWVLEVLFKTSVMLMNWVVEHVEGLPHSVIKDLYISPIEFAALMLMLLVVLVMVRAKNKRLIVASLSLLLLFVSCYTVRKVKGYEEVSMTIYHVRKHSVVDFVWPRHHVLMADSSFFEDQKAFDYSVKGNWAKKPLCHDLRRLSLDVDSDEVLLQKRGGLVAFGPFLMALWDGSMIFDDTLDYRIKVDFVMIRGAQKPDIKTLLYVYDPCFLLLDGSVPFYHKTRWEAAACEVKMPIYSTSDDGALVCNCLCDDGVMKKKMMLYKGRELLYIDN